MLLKINSIKKKIFLKKNNFSIYILKWFKKNSKVYPWRKTSNPYKVMIYQNVTIHTEKMLFLIDSKNNRGIDLHQQ